VFAKMARDIMAGRIETVPVAKSRASFLPQTTRGWVAVGVLVIIVAAFIIPIHVPPLFGWHLVQGRSMWPTIKWMEKWPHISGYVHINKDLAPSENSLILFRVNNKRFSQEVKRVEYSQLNPLTGIREYWVATDNAGVTGEGSDFSNQYKWIPQTWLIGVVDKIWTPTRASRSKTVEGKLRNWIEFNYPPSRQHWSPSQENVAVDSNPLRVYAPGNRLVTSLQDCCFASWQGDSQFIFWSDRLHEVVRVYNIKDGTISEANPELRSSLAQNLVRPHKQSDGLIWLAKPEADQFRWDIPHNGFCQLFLYGRWDNLCPYGHKLVIEAGGKRHKADLINTADIDLQLKKQCTLICLFDVKDQERPSGVPTILASP
jgi:hypothetical protein